jgi:hypothetical protein
MYRCFHKNRQTVECEIVIRFYGASSLTMTFYRFLCFIYHKDTKDTKVAQRALCNLCGKNKSGSK